jgi:hypothetical protein
LSAKPEGEDEDSKDEKSGGITTNAFFSPRWYAPITTIKIYVTNDRVKTQRTVLLGPELANKSLEGVHIERKNEPIEQKMVATATYERKLTMMSC